MSAKRLVICQVTDCGYSASPESRTELEMAMASHTARVHGLLAKPCFVVIDVPDPFEECPQIWFYPCALKCATCGTLSRTDIPISDPEHGDREIALTCSGCGEISWDVLRITVAG